MDPDSGFSEASERQLEDQLSQVPTELYLITRLQKCNARLSETISSKSTYDDLGTFIGKFPSSNFFETSDDVDPLQLAAFYEDDSMIADTLRGCDDNMLDIANRSSNGYSAVHYACIGGHLSTLKLLLENGGDAAGRDISDITPLHLAVLFSLHETRAAVDILVKYGASPDAASDFTPWGDLDIGPPLH